MAYFNNKLFQKLNNVDPCTVTFGLFSSEEIVNISVLKVTNSTTFDLVGYPVPGGLYDLRLGSFDFNNRCSTCYNNNVKCPGHFGHIELPVPVVNPLFYDVVVKLLKTCCLTCYTITVAYDDKFLLINQLRLLNRGRIQEAIEFSLCSSRPKDMNSDQYRNVIAEMIQNESKFDRKPLLTEDVVERRGSSSLRESFLKALSIRKKCSTCSKKATRMGFFKKSIDNIGKGQGKSMQQSSLTPQDMMMKLRNIYENEKVFMNELIPVLKTISSKYPTDVFFFTAVPVTPVNVRPPNFVNGRVTEHSKNKVYKSIIEDCFVVRNLMHLIKTDGSVDSLTDDFQLIINKLHGKTLLEKLHYAQESLQIHCDALLDDKKPVNFVVEPVGLKQMLEKKEGIIRMCMMGKRVNYAARSVITPDPNLNIDEIGIPEEFAKKLTYPVPVTPWNVKLLRKMVINGPDIYPGAVSVEMLDGAKIRLLANDPTQRESVANQLLTPGGIGGIDMNKNMKILHRHLINGDILLMNRQPTLHKPSIMGHSARILKGERTIRMHYSNCKSYNADFDGDEMNAHFPQSELARSEAYNIVSVCKQYLVPKDGTPLGGLIQDHMISGVRLTMRGRFFTRDDYMQLVFQALPYVHGDIKILPPSIMKPIALWSGKQIISTLILNITPKGKQLINLESIAKINSKAWPQNDFRSGGGIDLNFMSEAEVIIRNGELLCGVLDKMHYGATPYSLVHCLYELYGGECSSKLLSSLSKLFTAFLQMEGFTLGIKDILLTEEADHKRSKFIKKVRKAGREAALKSLDLPEEIDEESLKIKLEEAHRGNSKFRQIIDREYKILLDSFTNKINSTCVPNGLIQRFPDNNLQLMVQSGAKGSTVNTMQISSLLGQIELEGKRPPLMVSGRSLPSFQPYDTSAIAGGFVASRFMTGIRPQEFFFHCMAGREGLIDTAVKTSRSGYLQRCLIKHLEDLTVGYDMTVRTSDGSIVQFQYGEDGLDVTKSQFLNKKQVKFLAENSDAVVNNNAVEKFKSDTSKADNIKKHNKLMKSFKKRLNSSDKDFMSRNLSPFALFSLKMKDSLSKSNLVNKKTGRTSAAEKLCKMWINMDDDAKSIYYKKTKRQPDPISCQLQPDRDFGVISERLETIMDDYFSEKENQGASFHKTKIQDMIHYKSVTSMCSAGEPVGVLAAQSVGEPSTQMTLNTFHFAGRGEMNVTLGIPRLREILMMATKSIKTPSIDVPFLDNVRKLEKKADRLRKSLCRITLAEVLEYVTVTERQVLTNESREQMYIIHFQLLPQFVYRNNTHITPRQIINYIETKFIKNVLKDGPGNSNFVLSVKDRPDEESSEKNNNDDDMDIDEPEPIANFAAAENEDSSEEEADVHSEDDATAVKQRGCRKEEQEYEEKEEGDLDAEDKDADVLFNDELVDDDKMNKSFNDEGNDQGAEINEDELFNRTANVIHVNDHVVNYRFDAEEHMWCELTLSYPMCMNRFDFSVILRERASKSIIFEVPGIRRAFTYKANDKLMLKTDGCNFSEILKHDKLLDLNKLYCNDIHAISETYGIEAALKVIVKEVHDVFKAYGITVDPRHLSLIADYMTFNGIVEPLNRKGMGGILSPLQQMSFESACQFLKSAVLQNKTDRLMTPSSRLIAGLPCRSGTGIIDIRQSVKAYLSV